MRQQGSTSSSAADDRTATHDELTQSLMAARAPSPPPLLQHPEQDADTTLRHRVARESSSSQSEENDDGDDGASDEFNYARCGHVCIHSLFCLYMCSRLTSTCVCTSAFGFMTGRRLQRRYRGVYRKVRAVRVSPTAATMAYALAIVTASVVLVRCAARDVAHGRVRPARARNAVTHTRRYDPHAVDTHHARDDSEPNDRTCTY